MANSLGHYVTTAYGATRGLRNLCAALGVMTVAAHAETVTIAALGDSLTQGYGLAVNDGFTAQLERWLIDQGADVRVINAGVSGDTTAGGLSRIDWTLTPEVDAIIVELGGNDFLRGIDPAVSRANLDGILTRTDAAGIPELLAGLTVSNNYGPDYKTAFEAMYPDLADVHGAILYPDFFAALGDDPSQVMQSDGIHPNADGVALIVADIGPKVLELIAAAQ